MHRMTWTERLNMIAARAGEPELFFGRPPGEWETPYHDPTTVVGWMYEKIVSLLLEVPVGELESCGSACMVAAEYAYGATMPLNAVRILSAAIRYGISDTYSPCVYVSPAEYILLSSIPAGEIGIFTVKAGLILFTGQQLRLTLAVDPGINAAVDQPFVPPGYDEEIIDYVHKLMLNEDYMPAGRL